MLDHLKGNYGPHFDEFIRPSQGTQTWRRPGNYFGDPSEEEVLSSQCRDLAGAKTRQTSTADKALSYGTHPARPAPGGSAGGARRRPGEEYGWPFR